MSTEELIPLEQPVVLVGPGIRVVVAESVPPGQVFLVDAAHYWRCDPEDGWMRPLFIPEEESR